MDAAQRWSFFGCRGMHYILDGYNIIHKSPVFAQVLSRSLESARHGLVNVCKTLLQTRGDVEKITIVFDGKSDIFPDDLSSGRIEVIYTVTGEDADDRIVDYLRGTQLRHAAIVSDDNYVCNSARAFKVKSLSVADFLGLLRKPAAKVKAKTNGSGKLLSQKQSDDITKAYAEYLGLK